MSDRKISLGSIAAFLTIGGIICQAAAYMAALGFYRNLGMTPEQLGVTPLNALGRLFFTGFFAAMICLLLFALILVAHGTIQLRFHLFNFTPNAEGKEKVWKIKRKGIKGLYVAKLHQNFPGKYQIPIPAQLLIICLFASTLLALAYNEGQKASAAYKDPSSDTPGITYSPVQVDLRPAAVIYRWTKKEEIPANFYSIHELQPNNIDLRAGSLIGINNGVTYILDWQLDSVIAVPSTQIQMSIS